MSEKKSLIYFASGLRLNGVDNMAQLHATVDAAVRAGVSFWPVDARGLVREDFPLGGILRCEIVLIARDEAHALVVNESDGAVTVPLDFEKKCGIVEGLFDGGRQHGVDRGWQRLVLGSREILHHGGH